MQVTTASLKIAVQNEDDFGHEMRVRKILESAHWAEVSHGWTYLDPQEQKPRQFDLRLKVHHKAWERCIQLAVECKNLSPDAPLVISGTSRSVEESFHEYILSENALNSGIGGGRPGHNSGVRRSSSPNSVYVSGQFVGKSLMRFKPDPKDPAKLVRGAVQESEIYGRWSQALASANDLCKAAPRYGLGPAPDRATTMTIPCVVVPDGTLWACFYDSDGNLKSDPVPRDEVHFFVNHAIEVNLLLFDDKVALTHIHFLTVTGLKTFIEDLNANVPHIWNRWFTGGQVR